MKNHEKTFAEDGNGKGSKNTRKYVPKWDAEARAECLHPAQHSLQHLTLKIVAHHFKGKVPAANKKKSLCGEGA